MRVFLSWSGEASHKTAAAFYDWLPVILQNIKPFISSEDLRKGGRWNADLSQELESANFGIICVTSENVEAPWILFEAGALSKFVTDSQVIPFLLDVKPSDLAKPLTHFNAAKYEKSDIFKIVKAINDAQGDARAAEALLARSFDACWPNLNTALESALQAVPKDNKIQFTNQVDDQGDKLQQIDSILQEILVLSRNSSQAILTPEKIIPPEYFRHLMRDASIAKNSIPPDHHPAWNDIFESIENLNNLIPPDALITDASALRSITTSIRNIADALEYIYRRIYGERWRDVRSLRKRKSASSNGVISSLTESDRNPNLATIDGV